MQLEFDAELVISGVIARLLISGKHNDRRQRKPSRLQYTAGSRQYDLAAQQVLQAVFVNTSNMSRRSASEPQRQRIHND